MFGKKENVVLFIFVLLNAVHIIQYCEIQIILLLHLIEFNEIMALQVTDFLDNKDMLYICAPKHTHITCIYVCMYILLGFVHYS